MKIKKILFVAFGVFALAISINFVHAWYTWSFQTWDFVDSGKHMDWSGSTTYTTEWNHGVNTWNNHISGVIRKDTLTTVNDVTISDINGGDNGWAGQTNPNNNTIKFNTYYMSTYTTNMKKNVTTHEIGHALRLAHRNESTSIIQEYVTSITTLNDNDKAHYTYAYSNLY